jgi:hypothetical protein
LAPTTHAAKAAGGQRGPPLLEERPQIGGDHAKIAFSAQRHRLQKRLFLAAFAATERAFCNES